MAKKSRKRGVNKHSGMYMIVVVVLILCCIFAYNSFEMKSKLNEKAQVEAELREQIAEQEALKEELVKESEYIQSDEYIKERAHDMGLVSDNEIIFKKEQQ